MLRYIVGIKQYDSSNNYFIGLLCLHAHLLCIEKYVYGNKFKTFDNPPF